MKKTKLLTPIMAIATLGSITPIVTLATSCNKNSGEEIELDESTAKEQTTTANLTMTTYAFNLKNKLNWQTNDEETDEVDAEIEDVETSTDVTVEISSLQYDAETGKFYVTITTSKEEGTLNENDTVTFSLNFHCHKKGSTHNKWERKFTKFLIKYSSSQYESGHFDDTDVTKKIKILETDLDDYGNFSKVINFPTNETWKETSPGTGEYDLSKLNCYIYRDNDHKRFIDTVLLQKTALTITLGDDGKSIDVKITGHISDLAVKDHTQARFALVFTYPDTTVFQTIGGFSVNYVSKESEPHVQLFGSREQHYYTTKTSTTETTKNFIAFYLDSDTYQKEDLSVTVISKPTNGTYIDIGQQYLLGPVAGKQILAVDYTIKHSTQNIDAWDDVFNVSFQIKSTHVGGEWTEIIKGMSFTTVDKLSQTSLISYDQTALSDVVWKAKTKTDFNDVLRTCFPYVDITQFVYQKGYVELIQSESDVSTYYTCDLSITQLGYLPENEHYSLATIDTSSVQAAKYLVRITIYVVTWNAAYEYHLNAGTYNFKE